MIVEKKAHAASGWTMLFVNVVAYLAAVVPVSYTHLTLPTTSRV